MAADYGVQARMIVALWGVESTYGSFHGDFPVIGALATLAYDGRRASFFRGELIQALKIVDHGDVTAAGMTGSWAGAMGQSQFMPSSYLAYAVDYDRDGRRDIWTSLPDVFASIANYLAKAGWNDRRTWGRKVSLPPTVDGELAGLQIRKPLPQWQALGVRQADGGDLPRVEPVRIAAAHRRRAGAGLSRLRQFPGLDGLEPLDLFRPDRGRACGSDRRWLTDAVAGPRAPSRRPCAGAEPGWRHSDCSAPSS